MDIRKISLMGAAAMAMGLAVCAATPASAYVACNADECWHTESRVHVPGMTFSYHPDDWYFHQHWDDTHHWRDYHAGRGYYRGGIWVTL